MSTFKAPWAKTGGAAPAPPPPDDDFDAATAALGDATQPPDAAAAAASPPPPPPPPPSGAAAAVPFAAAAASAAFAVVNPLRFSTAATPAPGDAEKSPAELKAEREAAQAKAEAAKAREEAARVKEEARAAVEKANKEAKDARAEASSAKAAAATALAMASTADSRIKAAAEGAEAPPLYLPAPLHGVDEDGTIKVDEASNKLIEYIVFIERIDLTKIPPPQPESCAVKCCKVLGCCTKREQFAYNRLKHMRTELFGKLDGPVSILEPSSFNPLTNEYTVLNYVDQEDIVRKKQATVSGLVRKNVLYKLLPKENIYVPNADWVDQMERSEVMEVTHFLQLAGAVMIETEHRPVGAFIQPVALPEPAPKGDGKTAEKLSWCAKQACNFAGSIAIGAASGISDTDPLNGRIIFRNNALPVKGGIQGLINAMGNDYFHVRRMPALMDRLRLRLDRGLLVADIFVCIHFNNSSTHLPGMHRLQEGSMPDGVDFSVADAIDCGWRSPFMRPRFSTTFRVLYPDVHEAKSGILAGNQNSDIPLETVPTFEVPKKPLHPMSSLESWDNLKVDGKSIKKSSGPALELGFFAKKEAEKDEKTKQSDAEKELKEKNKAERRAHRAEVSALKKHAAELSVDLYLERSFREFVANSKGVPTPRSRGFSLPSWSSRRPATAGNGIVGFVTRFFGREEAAGASGGGDNDSDDEAGAGADIPEPISATRPVMAVPAPAPAPARGAKGGKPHANDDL